MRQNAIIIPLFKVGRLASQLVFFCPVFLTSCVVNTLGRMIANKLYAMAKKKGCISSAQVGFRKHHSWEDQILRVTQSVSECGRNVRRLLLFYCAASIFNFLSYTLYFCFNFVLDDSPRCQDRNRYTRFGCCCCINTFFGNFSMSAVEYKYTYRLDFDPQTVIVDQTECRKARPDY